MGKDSSGKGVGSNPQKDLSLGGGSKGGGKTSSLVNPARGERAAPSGSSRKGNFAVDAGTYRLDFPVLRSHSKGNARTAKGLGGEDGNKQSPAMPVHMSDASDSEEEGAASSSRTVLGTDRPEVFLGDSPSGSLSRKRPTSPVSVGPVAPKVGTSRKGDKRPVTNSHFLAAAESTFEERSADAANEDLDEGPGYRPSYRDLGGAHESNRDEVPHTPQAQTKETLAAKALLNVATIQAEIKKSGHIKGTTWGAINNAAAGVIDAVEALRTITPAEEHRRLRADNDRLARELDIVRAELRAFKMAFEKSRAGTAKVAKETAGADLKEVIDELRRDLRVSLGGMINARLGELEARLPPEPVLRPPLAADRRQEPPARPRTQPNLAAGAMREPQPSPMPKKATAGAKAGHQLKKAATTPNSQPQPGKEVAGTLMGVKNGPIRGPQTQSQPVAGISRQEEPIPNTTFGAEAPWTKVVGRKAKAVKGKAQTPAPLKAPPTKALKIVTPRTAAVVLTIKEGATMSYSEVLVKARTSIKLADVGLESVKVRTTMTGSKMLEVGGENPDASADRLAEKLRAAVGDSVDVTRPTKLAELKISGMDETVSREEIAGVLAAIGRCTPEVVKVGTIRAGPWGQASALIRCPAVAAKAIAKEGKVVLGWSTATIKPVEALPMRCYKCMALGHTRALCPSEADHGAKCFRCGKEGHLAAACEATPKCAVCAQAGRSHAHVMGGPKVLPPLDQK
ncbi:hypothetical protein MSG28_007205 [Choristoneura fumiferana]|uniref:Uncharacterized protein n=1 Tax=Choristoneura fumiferana TaxID=7141 RepID=A0ACC0JMS9_CHOFU|nr:hypothetical protein MSG28_007205 [Choristoneura fumiferana]